MKATINVRFYAHTIPFLFEKWGTDNYMSDILTIDSCRDNLSLMYYQCVLEINSDRKNNQGPEFISSTHFQRKMESRTYVPDSKMKTKETNFNSKLKLSLHFSISTKS